MDSIADSTDSNTDSRIQMRIHGFKDGFTDSKTDSRSQKRTKCLATKRGFECSYSVNKTCCYLIYSINKGITSLDFTFGRIFTKSSKGSYCFIPRTFGNQTDHWVNLFFRWSKYHVLTLNTLEERAKNIEFSISLLIWSNCTKILYQKSEKSALSSKLGGTDGLLAPF